MNNNITNLSSIGFSNYIITESGKVYSLQALDKELKTDKNNRFYLIDDSGKPKRKALKLLYRIAYKKEFCIDQIEDLKEEKWKIIPNTNDRYLISNFGRVKSLCGYSAIILKADITKNGYVVVKINRKNIRVHQLVANAFCDNKYKGTKTKIEIHHKNKIKTDNKAANLLVLSIKEHHEIHRKKETADNE